jgi:hypothetical protein
MGSEAGAGGDQEAITLGRPLVHKTTQSLGALYLWKTIKAVVQGEGAIRRAY